MTEKNADSKVLTAEDLSALFSVPMRTIVRLAKEKKIPAMKIGGKWRFDRDTIYRWMKQQSSLKQARKLLIVDDSPTDRQACRRPLEKMGFDVAEVSSVDEAVERMEHEKFDALLVDLVFKNQDKQGLDLLEWLSGRSMSVPVVIFTAYADTEHMKDVLKYGWFVVLSKPIIREQLTEAMAAVFKVEDME